MRNKIGWVLFMVSLVMLVVLLVKPFIMPKGIKEISGSELYPIGDDADGESWYVVLKHEMKDWVEIIIKPLSPFAVAVFGFWIKRKK